MMFNPINTRTISYLERWFAPILKRLPPKLAIEIYSKGRKEFLKILEKEAPSETYSPPENLSRTLWGIKFNSPIMNSAGMFKNGGFYDLVVKQGAGGYLGGTTTWNERDGNTKENIHLPFVPYRDSHSASNWLGLPNDGDSINSWRAKKIVEKRVEGVPIGWSLMASSDLDRESKLIYLVKSMFLYTQAGVDFIEINESCPNTERTKSQDSTLEDRLKYIKENFLDKRQRRLPVIVKFSNDTSLEQVPELLDLLFELGYDGVNFGNTSTNYKKRRIGISPSETKLYDFFTNTFGGGVSGRPLRESSLELCTKAVQHLKERDPKQDFHVIRTGGIETAEDIRQSEEAGIKLNQWFTGYFDNFALHGHNLYRELYKSLSL